MGKFKDWLKRSKILSNAAKLIPFAGPSISETVENLGYGKRRRRTRVAKHRAARMSQFAPDGRFLGDPAAVAGAGTVKFRTKSGKVVSFKTKKRRGAGFKDWIRKGVNAVKTGINKAKDINNKLKEKKYISNISGKAGQIANIVGLNKIGDIANKISEKSSQYGYGKRRRRRGGLRFKQNGGLKFNQNGGAKVHSSAITKVPTNRPILNGLAKPCGFNHKGLYNPQNSLQSFLAYKLTT